MTPVRAQRRVALFAAALAIAAPAAAAAAGPGNVDTAFGSGGVTLSQFSQDGALQQTSGASEAIAGNGDIYQAGTTMDPSGNPEIFVARYLPTGALDGSFGAGGVSVAQIGQGTTKTSGNTLATPPTIALTSSGEVVVPSMASDASGGTQIAVAEFAASGGLDSSFATGGVYYDDSASTASPKAAFADAAAVQSDGKIVITADATLSSGGEAFVRRLNADGTVDTGFATGGTYLAPTGTSSHPTQVTGVIVDGAGNIDFTGTTPQVSGSPAVMLDRLTATGASVFAQVAQASTISVGAQSGGFSLIRVAYGDDIVGADAYVDSPGVLGGIPSWVAVAFGPSGAVDHAFGPNGTGVTALLPGGFAPTSIAQQVSGQLVYTGLVGIGGGTSGVAVARTLANGALDTSFGATGVVTLPYGETSFGSSGAIGPDGQLTVSGVQVLPAGLAGFTSQALLTKVTLDRPPSVVLAAPAAVAGQPVLLSAAAIGDSPISSVRWDLGSGAFTDASGLTATTTFAAPGTYPVRVQATDGDDQSTIATRTVIVVAAAPQPSTPPPTTVTIPTPFPAGDCTVLSRPTATIRAKILSPQGLLLAGTAAAHCPSQVASVGVAIARVKAKKCGFLSSAHRWGKYGKCTAPKSYLRATGTYSWAFGLKLKLARGTYWIWRGATDNHGASSANTAASHIALKR